MDEWDNDFEDEPEALRPRSEGVRILGAEEAAAVVGGPRAGEPAPSEPLRFERHAPTTELPVLPRDDGGPGLPVTPAPPQGLPHWTEPPTGEVPAVLSGRFGETDVDPSATEGQSDDDLAAWSALSGGAPRWRDQNDAWDDAGFDDASVLAGGEPPMGALDERRSGSMFDFDDDEDDADSFGNLGVDDEIAPIPLKPPGAGAATSRSPRPRPPRPTTRPPTGTARRPTGAPASSPRDLQAALALAGGLGAVALILFKLGPEPTMVLATAVVLIAAAELFDVLRRAGYQPATLVGLAGTLAIMVGTYAKGEQAIPLAIVLVTATTFAWYLVRVVNARPTVNVAATLLAFLWTGVFGSYAALILSLDKRDHAGVALLLGVVIAVVANDTGAYFVGSSMGTRSLAPEVSPNKTVEGVLGGAAVCIVVTFFILKVFPGVSPWDGGKALWLAVVVSIVAPLGDLAESMVKRDLGLKDMGSILPGHGGVLDRFDSMLWCLPASYYLLIALG
ncbi:MAG TPA: phosphatidate cytidylyltransferase [Acidimicrobiales bacterium]|nr:phosphatidate cytidylyltransferase [Acidimicrobiales bacterium]